MTIMQPNYTPACGRGVAARGTGGLTNRSVPHSPAPSRITEREAFVNTITDTDTSMTTMLRKARAAVLLARLHERGILTIDAALVTAWAASGWTAAQIEQAAHDLADAGAVRLTTTPDGTPTITAVGGRR